MGKPIWKGSPELQEQPDSPEIVESNGELTITQRFEGPYAAALAGRPKIGTPMQGFPVPVESSRVTKAKGGRGILTVTGKVATSSLDGTPVPIGEPILEIDWVRVTRPIEKHPIFASLDDKTVREIKEAVQDSKKTIVSLPENGLKLFQKLIRGQDSYDVWCPMITRTSTFYGKPLTSNCGMRDAPPLTPGGTWQYLKTGDTSRRENRRWTRSEEWTGADEIDADIYD